MMKQTRILHLDADAFAAAVHRLVEPSLRGALLVVGEDAGGRGIVHCASYEVRRLVAVRAGMLLAHVRRLVPEIVVRPPRPLDYERMSRQIFEFLRARAPLVEQASLDDFFLDLTGCERWVGGDLSAWAVRLLRELSVTTGIPCSGALAGDKFTARAATRLAKPQGLLVVTSGAERDFLQPLPLALLPDVPRDLLQGLHEFGVRRVADLDAIGKEPLEVLFGARGAWLWAATRGQWRPLVVGSRLDRCLEADYLFEPDTTLPDRLEAALLLLSEQLTYALRREALRSQRMVLTLLYSDERTEQRTVTIPYASNQPGDWRPALLRAMQTMAQRRVRVRRLHLAAHVEEGRAMALDFLEERRLARRQALYAAVDRVRTRHGFRALLPPRALGALAAADREGGAFS